MNFILFVSVAKFILSCNYGSKILHGYWAEVLEEFEFHATQKIPISRYVHKNSRIIISRISAFGSSIVLIYLNDLF